MTRRDARILISPERLCVSGVTHRGIWEPGGISGVPIKSGSVECREVLRLEIMLLAIGEVALQPGLPVFGRDDVVVLVEEQEVAGYLNQCEHIAAFAFANDFRRVG